MTEALFTSFVATGLAVAFFMAIDEWFELTVKIMLATIYLTIVSLPLRIRLMWQIFWMKRSYARYQRMAEQIMQELKSE